MKRKSRIERLVPNGEPKYIRCYDNDGESFDRYTVIFTKFRANPGHERRGFHVGMSASPFHPQGFGQHGEFTGQSPDVDQWGFPPRMGRKGHLGRRIPFSALPDDCKALVLRDYREIWGIDG